MIPRSRNSLRLRLLLTVFLGLIANAVGAQDSVSVTEITPKLLVFSPTAGNDVAAVGQDGALLLGTPPATSTTKISTIVAGHPKSPVRYVVIAPKQDVAHSESDAGWGRRGVFVAMQEKSASASRRGHHGCNAAIVRSAIELRSRPFACRILRGVGIRPQRESVYVAYSGLKAR
jgi:hypothetical protein